MNDIIGHIDPTVKCLLEPAIHSIATQNNTNFSRQIGKSVKLKKVRKYLKLKPENFFNQMEDETSVTAFELKKPKNDKISLRFMPPNTCMQENADFFCVSRTVWEQINNAARKE